MSPETIKAAVGEIKAVREELSTLGEIVQDALGREPSGAVRTSRLRNLLGGAELTCTLRLFAAFEAGLFSLGPHLPTPYAFPEAAGLAEKIQKIAAEMRMPSRFRDAMDVNVRELRNELGHGRSIAPRLTFEAVYDLMRQLYRGCR